jgi:2'-5' RNA ligase
MPLAPLLSGPARRFRPHVTLMPRFDADASPAVQSALANTALPQALVVRGPRSPAPGLLWYESDPDCEGHAEMIALHHLCASFAKSGCRAYSGSGFRPHMTIASETGPLPKGLPETLRLTPISMAIYHFGHDPDFGPVSRHPIRPSPEKEPATGHYGFS